MIPAFKPAKEFVGEVKSKVKVNNLILSKDTFFI